MSNYLETLKALALQRVRIPEAHFVRGTVEDDHQARARPRSLPVRMAPILHVQYVRHAEATRRSPKGDSAISVKEWRCVECESPKYTP